MDTVTYPDFIVRQELSDWVEALVDTGAQPEIAQAFGVVAIPTAVAMRADGTILDRKPDFVEPSPFAAWLRATREGAFASPADSR